MSELKSFLRKAINHDLPIRIKYYPNRDGRQVMGWRSIYVLDIFSKNGVEYLFAWFESGASVSGDSGYRLFFVRNIQDWTSTGEIFKQPVNAMRLGVEVHRVTKAEVLASVVNVRHFATMMYLKGAIE